MSEADLARYFAAKKVPYTKPLFSINLKKDEEILDWFRQVEFSLGEYYRPLFNEQKDNLSYFIGAGINPNFASPYVAAYATTSVIYADPCQVFINDMYRVASASVATVVAHDLVPDVLPNSVDYKDKVCCNVVKDWLESINYDLDTESWRQKWEMQKTIFGESFVIPMWDPNVGDLHPLAKEYFDEDLELEEESGEVVSDMRGESIKINKTSRIGDVVYVNPLPWDVQIDPSVKYDDKSWFYWKEYIDVEYLKKKFPKYNWETSGNTGEKIYDAASNSSKQDPNRRTIFYLFHRSHEFMPEGRFLIASKEHVLVNTTLGMPTIINNQDLPLVRFADLDLGYGTRAIPMFFRNNKNIVDAYNNVTNQMYSNIELESPKMFVHESSGVDPQRMPNGTTAIEWVGQYKPTIETPSTNNPSLFNFRDALKRNIDEMSMQTPMVRGDVPNAQLDSFIALQYFEDLRNLLAAPSIKGHIRSMEHLFRLVITIARDKYKPDDGRLIKILGKHNSFQLRAFDPINLQKSYDVKITTTGNLATSKAARTQMMMTIKEKFPNVVSNDLFVDSLGLSHLKKFMNAATAAVSSAEEENQEMMNGSPVMSPTRFEDLIVHWETHRIPMQTLDFKHSSEEVKELFEGHVAATEKLMYEQAAENPVYTIFLEQLKQFPMFYTPKPVNEPMPGPEQIEGESPMPLIEDQSPDVSQLATA